MPDSVQKIATGPKEERQELADAERKDDQSAGRLSKTDSAFQNHKLNLYSQQLNQRQTLFASLLMFAVLMCLAFILLAAYLAHHKQLDQYGVIVLGVTAAMPTALILGLMRFVYRREDDSSSKDDDPKVTDVSAFISAVNELISATKGLFKKGD